MRDFTFRVYENLCNALLEKRKPVTVADFIKKNSVNSAIVRHDVDKKPQNALVMAEIEQSLGLFSTYYFRTVPESYNEDIIIQIHDMGHEIGFHYEVLDKAKGDMEKAITLFKHELAEFPIKVETICMHGNPLTPWDNRDLWLHYDFKKCGIIGEAYLSLDFSKIEYFSDTGRNWGDQYSVKDLTFNNDIDKKKFYGTGALVNHLKESSHSICIVTHPQRWNDAWIPWVGELFSQSFKNIGKYGIKKIRKKDSKS